MQSNNFEGLERRRYIRIHEEDVLVCEPFDVAAFGGKTSKRMHAFTKSLSEGGLLFESDQAFEIGALLKLQVDIPGWEKYKPEFRKGDEPSGRHPFIVLGKVVRIEDVGGGVFDIGVLFTAVDPGHKLALKKYLEREYRAKK
jgi:hypothetical protein